ncbi:MAG: hypothetical protein J5I53_03735 [Bradyrhizobiaceae bacterium]|nr:hypothetical protein [Bradyrhizobiaceae bacterium]
MELEALVGGTVASLFALFLVEVILLPINRRRRLRGTVGTYFVHHIDGTPIRNAADKSNYVKLKTKGWFSPKIIIEAFDYDTNRSWLATAHFDELGFHGYGFYRYADQVDGGTIDLIALADGKWACRTNAYHTDGVAVFHWYRQ